MSTRFDCYIPGFWRMLWLRIQRPVDWDAQCRALITDTHTGYQFRVSDEESAIMDLASDATSATPTAEVIASGRVLDRALELMSDELFLAMYNRRLGDETAWRRLTSMRHDDWRAWWANHEYQARVQTRGARN